MERHKANGSVSLDKANGSVSLNKANDSISLDKANDSVSLKNYACRTRLPTLNLIRREKTARTDRGRMEIRSCCRHRYDQEQPDWKPLSQERLQTPPGRVSGSSGGELGLCVVCWDCVN